jgi:hypothetical protein
MPSYRHPKFAYIEPRGTGGIPVVAAVLAVLGYGTYQLADFLATAIVAIAVVIAVVAVASVVTLVVVASRHRGRQHLDAPQWVTERLGAPRIPSHGTVPVRHAAAIPSRPVPAIDAPAIHYHLHLHAAPAAQPIAIEEDPQ